MVKILVLIAVAIASINARDNREDCYAEEKVYHRQSNKCYRLLTKGPCSDGEWLVLDKLSASDQQIRIEPKCVREKCRDGEYYWPETGSCVRAGDESRLCGESEELRSNVFGEGECSCTKEPPRARLRNEDGPCHVLYTKGPCRSGEILGFRNAVTDEPTCISDSCHFESRHRKRLGSLGRDGVLAPWRNGTCHELGTRGPCPEGYTFKVHSFHLRPSCVSLTNAIFDLAHDCFADERGNCQAEIGRGAKFKRGIVGVLRANRRRRNSRRMRMTQSPNW